jgi:AcrR family transcriptional regulator
MASVLAKWLPATSIQELVEATGGNRGSLYSPFGDKRRLSLALLDH